MFKNVIKQKIRLKKNYKFKKKLIFLKNYFIQKYFNKIIIKKNKKIINYFIYKKWVLII